MSASNPSSEGANTEVGHTGLPDVKLDHSFGPTTTMVQEDQTLEPEHDSGEPTPIAHNTGTSSPTTLFSRKKTATFTGQSTPHPERPSGSRRRTMSSAARGQRRIPTLRSFQRAASSLLIPDRRIGEAPSVWSSLKAIILASPLNLLLVFIPVSWALHFALPHDNSNRDTLVFVFSFLAIIPLAKLLGFATEELSLRVGSTLAGLLNATLGNAVELIVAIIALTQCKLRIVQASLVGSILSNLLLVLGMCFFAGGLRYQEQGFGAITTQLNSSLLTISVIAVLLPAAFHFSADLTDDQERRAILAVSRGTSIILLIIYIGYLLFQLWSHATLFQDDYPDATPSTRYAYQKKKKEKKEAKKAATKQEVSTDQVFPNVIVSSEPESVEPPSRRSTLGSAGQIRDVERASAKSAEEEPQMSVWMTFGLLVVVTVLVAVTAEFLVDSIDGLTDGGSIGLEFVGVILLPIVGNAAEHATAVTVSVKDKLNLSLSVAVGSSIQIALFVIPFIITLGWIIGKPMTLLFDPYESVVLFFSVLIVNYVVQDGKSNWLEGFILMLLYVVLSLTFWFYPGSDPSGTDMMCSQI